jgi:hypothetical protein
MLARSTRMGIGWWYVTVLLGDPAGVGAEVFAAGRRAAAAVLAWPVQQRFRPGVGAASAIEVTTL